MALPIWQIPIGGKSVPPKTLVAAPSATVGPTPTDQGGLVQPLGIPSPTKKVRKECEINEDCLSPEVCIEGYCRDPETLSPCSDPATGYLRPTTGCPPDKTSVQDLATKLWWCCPPKITATNPCPNPATGYLRPINGCPGGYSNVQDPVTKLWWCCKGKIVKKCVNDAECIGAHGAGWKCGTDGKCYAETCTKNEDCKAGEECIDGKCKKTTPKCVPGTACTQANIPSTCPGGKCENGKCVCPATTAPCEEGKVCLTGGDCGDGICEGLNDPVNPKLGYRSGVCRCTTGCPEGTGKAFTGCACGDEYWTTTGNCPSGYKFQNKPDPWRPAGKEGTKGKCTCLLTIQYCKEHPEDAYCKKDEGEEFKWSPELQALLARILDRANSLLDQPLGLSDEERQAIYNRIFEKIKGTEAPAIQSMLNRTSRQGLLGSPYAERGVAEIQRETRGALAGSERDIEIEEAQRRYEQLMGTTGMAQSLFGTGMGAESLVEAANAARRGEGTGSLNAILQYLISLGGQNSAYYQALLNWLTTHQG